MDGARCAQAAATRPERRQRGAAGIRAVAAAGRPAAQGTPAGRRVGERQPAEAQLDAAARHAGLRAFGRRRAVRRAGLVPAPRRASARGRRGDGRRWPGRRQAGSRSRPRPAVAGPALAGDARCRADDGGRSVPPPRCWPAPRCCACASSSRRHSNRPASLPAGASQWLPEPAAPELQLLTRAMNTMVDRLRSAVDDASGPGRATAPPGARGPAHRTGQPAASWPSSKRRCSARTAPRSAACCCCACAISPA